MARLFSLLFALLGGTGEALRHGLRAPGGAKRAGPWDNGHLPVKWREADSLKLKKAFRMEVLNPVIERALKIPMEYAEKFSSEETFRKLSEVKIGGLTYEEVKKEVGLYAYQYAEKLIDNCSDRGKYEYEYVASSVVAMVLDLLDKMLSQLYESREIEKYREKNDKTKDEIVFKEEFKDKVLGLVMDEAALDYAYLTVKARGIENCLELSAEEYKKVEWAVEQLQSQPRFFFNEAGKELQQYFFKDRNSDIKFIFKMFRGLLEDQLLDKDHSVQHGYKLRYMAPDNGLNPATPNLRKLQPVFYPDVRKTKYAGPYKWS